MAWGLIVAVLLLVAASAMLTRLPTAIKYLFLLRYPLLFAILILLVPRLNSRWWPTMLDLGPIEVFEVTVFMALAAWACVLAAMVILQTAPLRFQLAPIRWLPRIAVFRVWFGPALVMPFALRLILRNRDVQTVAAVVGAFAASFCILLILSALRQMFVPPKASSDLLLPAAWTPQLRFAWLSRAIEWGMPDGCARYPARLAPVMSTTIAGECNRDRYGCSLY